MRYIGLDLGKASIEVSVLSEAGEVVERFDTPNDDNGLTRLVGRLQPGDRVGLEAGTLAFPVHDHLVRQGYDVWVGDPNRMKVIWDCDHKFDKKDAYEIARLLRADMFPRVHVPRPDTLQDREFVRARFEAVDEGIRVKNRIHALLDRNGLRPPLKGKVLFEEDGLAWLRENHWKDQRDVLLDVWVDELESIQRRVGRLDVVVARLVVDHDVARRLITIPGIAYLWSAVTVFEVEDMDRFASIEKFCSYAGSAPKNNKSAGVDRSKGVVSRSNHRLKMAMGMAGEAATKTAHMNPVKACYLKQCRRGKRGKRALAPCRRMMARTVYAVWKNGEPCRWENRERTRVKLNELDRLARRGGGA